MATLDVLGRRIPLVGDGPPDIEAVFRAYSLTDRPAVLDNITAANQLAASLADAGLLEAFPLFVYVRDFKRHLCKPSPDEGWEILGGRLHGAHVRVDRRASPGVLTELHVVEFLRQSVGFTRDSATGGILIPEDGLYRVRLGGRVDGINSADPGRRFFSLKLNGVNLGGNVEFEGDTSSKLFDEWPFEKGDVLMPEAYQDVAHRTTGVKERRLIEATIGVYQSLNPSW